MPWFKVDDQLAFHAKCVAAGNAAMGLWVRAGSWAAAQVTAGHVPRHMIASLGNTVQAKRLVDVGLWERVEGGYQFHQWGERQTSREDVEKQRSEWRDRQRQMRHRRNHEKPGETADVTRDKA